jgi:iron-sulfur cluster assembly accessory protein
MTNIRLSPTAARQIQRIRAKDPDVAGLRLAVEGGGCSGFQYDIRAVAAPQADDIIVEQDGERLFVDAVSVPFLDNAELDWADELIGASFKVRNPNARTSCGCGVSFTV